jgi:hypothetical protein
MYFKNQFMIILLNLNPKNKSLCDIGKGDEGMSKYLLPQI